MFLTRWRILAFLGLAAFFAAAVALVVLDLQHRSRVRELTALADAAEADALRQRGIADSLRAVRVAATDTFRITHTKWLKVRESVHDSIPVPVEVIVRVADSAIAACDRALNACTAEVGVLNVALDSALSAAKLRKEALRPRRLFGFIPLPEGYIGIGGYGGYGVTAAEAQVHTGPQVGVGLQVGFGWTF